MTQELLSINVNDKTEKKNGLTYLSWAWAWAEVLKIDPQATWEAVEYQTPIFSESGAFAMVTVPCMMLPDGSATVKTKVTIKGDTKTCTLPVMNHRNQAIKHPDAFQINTAIMRCMTKAISMHGLGLYIYAGEDLPEAEPEKKIVTGARDGIGEDLPKDIREYLSTLAEWAKDSVKTGHAAAVKQRLVEESLEADQETYFFNLLDSTARNAIKKA